MGRDALALRISFSWSVAAFWLFHHFADQLFDSDAVYRSSATPNLPFLLDMNSAQLWIIDKRTAYCYWTRQLALIHLFIYFSYTFCHKKEGEGINNGASSTGWIIAWQIVNCRNTPSWWQWSSCCGVWVGTTAELSGMQLKERLTVATLKRKNIQCNPLSIQFFSSKPRVKVCVLLLARWAN